MMPFVPIAVIGFLSLVLQFDGSLRPPRDPIPGFTYSSPKNMDGIDRFASCSAAIFWQGNNGGIRDNNSVGGNISHNGYYSIDRVDEKMVVALGGKLLEIVPMITSADVEYEGLLYGLDWLIDSFSAKNEIKYDGDNDIMESVLIIRGDCKAVIDQLNSRSVPRKMETKYCLVMDKIQSLKELYSLHQRRTTPSLSPDIELSVLFEHLPREKNCLCDALCKLVINWKQASIVLSIVESIKLDETSASQNDINNFGNIKKSIKSKKNSILSPEHSLIKSAMVSICDIQQTSCSSEYLPLCHSSRLALACELTKSAVRLKDAVTLHFMVDFFEQLSRRWSRVYYIQSSSFDADNSNNNNDGNFSGKGTLRKVSAFTEVISLHYLGATGDANSLAKKRKISGNGVDDWISGLDESLGFILNFLARNRSSPCVGLDDSVTSNLLSPYFNVSEMIASVEEQHKMEILECWAATHGIGWNRF